MLERFDAPAGVLLSRLRNADGSAIDAGARFISPVVVQRGRPKAPQRLKHGIKEELAFALRRQGHPAACAAGNSSTRDLDRPSAFHDAEGAVAAILSAK